MKNFLTFIAEDINAAPQDDDLTQSHVPGATSVTSNFLQHLSSPTWTPEEAMPKFKPSINEEVFLSEAKIGPKSEAAIETGRRLQNEIAPGENLVKRAHKVFNKTLEEHGKETPAERKAKLKEAHEAFKGFASNYGLKSNPHLLNENGKTKKSSGEGVHTKGLTLAPHGLNGLHDVDVCPRASAECRKNCLGTEAGRNRQFPDSSLHSKLVKTHFMLLHPHHFARILHHEVGQHEKAAIKKGYKPGVRLNVTSDISWEHMAPKIIHDHKNTQFYDYTKMHHRVGNPNLPENYHLALSHTGSGHAESNDHHVAKALEAGHVVASVHKGKHAPQYMLDRKTGKKYPTIDGDKDDNTFDRHTAAGLKEGEKGHGVVSHLKLKGASAVNAGHFANEVHHDEHGIPHTVIN